MPGSTKEEFDGLNHKILNNLYKGDDFDRITRVLESELSVNYGLYCDEFNVDKISSEIVEWWDLKLVDRN